jgi:predicted transcriptional regulator
MSMVKEAPIGVRLESDVRAALEKLAKQEDRSISYLISRIVTDYLKAKKLLK